MPRIRVAAGGGLIRIMPNGAFRAVRHSFANDERHDADEITVGMDDCPGSLRARNWDCANWHLAEWSVTVATDGALKIGPSTEYASDPLPFSIEPEPTALSKKTGLTDLDFAGRRHVLPVSDGLIVGFD